MDTNDTSLPNKSPHRRGGLLTVTGFDRDDVIFRTNDAGTVQFRDEDGDLVAMFVRKNGKIWFFCARGDDDWDQCVRLFSNNDAGIEKGPPEGKGVPHASR